MLTPETLAGLQTTYADLLDELAHADLSAARVLPLLTHLRKFYPSEIAAAALQTAQLRRKGALKFEHAAHMFFTDEALQQATTQTVAEHHARILMGYNTIANASPSRTPDTMLTLFSRSNSSCSSASDGRGRSSSPFSITGSSNVLASGNCSDARPSTSCVYSPPASEKRKTCFLPG